MKALVISGANIRHMPYLFNYFNQLALSGYETTLFYWDRDGLADTPLPPEVEPIKFTAIMKNEIPKYKKILNFIKFRTNVLNEIKSNNYDKIIVCDTQFAVLLSDVLLLKFKKRYIFDYRDLSYEYIYLYKKIIGSLIKNSAFTYVSSDAYRKNLPEFDNIYTIHNITVADLARRELRKNNTRKKEVITISFWGCIRELETQMRFIKGIENDMRFEMHYYGTIDKTALRIVSYCNTNKVNNIYIHNEYLPHEKYNFVKTTDIIHNVYANEGRPNPAMGNKFYDGIIFYLPQICNADGFMGAEALKHDVGIIVDLNTSFADKIFDYYQNIEWTDFEGKCDTCLKNILVEQDTSLNVLRSVL